jgi:hypothetical protein
VGRLRSNQSNTLKNLFQKQIPTEMKAYAIRWNSPANMISWCESHRRFSLCTQIQNRRYTKIKYCGWKTALKWKTVDTRNQRLARHCCSVFYFNNVLCANCDGCMNLGGGTVLRINFCELKCGPTKEGGGGGNTSYYTQSTKTLTLITNEKVQMLSFRFLNTVYLLLQSLLCYL